MNMLKNRFSYIIFLFPALCLLAYSCANRGLGPQGGPKDETPPRLVGSTPALNATNFRGQTIVLEFDEFIQVKDVYKNVIISPPQRTAPIMKAMGRRFTIELTDTLQENTTYTIDFGNAIADNNEGNVLANFSFAFSTGNEIDTLVFTGTLVDAQTLNRVDGSLVGIHSNLSDTAFITLPFARMTRTNATGNFTIRNVREGDYHIFALDDQNANFFFDQLAEAIAFLDSIVQPSIPIKKKKIPVDTTKTDSVSIKKDRLAMLKADSISMSEQNSRLILFQFLENFRKQFFVKAERREREKFTLFFNAPLEEYPIIEPLNFEFSTNYLLQSSVGKDTLTYWLLDTLVRQQDTLNFILHYPKTDSIGDLVPTQDTLHLALRQESRIQNQPRKQNRREREQETVKTDYLTFATNASGVFEYYNYPRFIFSNPIREFDVEKINFFRQIQDTIWSTIPFNMYSLDSIRMNFELNVDLKAGEKYKIELDSAAFTGIFGNVTEKRTLNFNVRNLEEYATLIINVTPFDERIIIQLLNGRDEVVTQEKADAEGTIFDFLTPDVYFVRLFFDENGNEKWDTGNFRERRQPEKVYYFNKKISLRANWEVEETWDYTSLPVLMQRPEELKGKQAK